MEKQMLATARIRQPHGVHGYLRLESFSGETRHLLKLKTVVLENESERERFVVEDGVAKGKAVLLKLQGIDTPEAGKHYANWIVWVDRKKAAGRKRNEYYAADLTGCKVKTEQGCFGRIEAVCDSDSGAYLEIRDLSGETYIIPFSKSHVGKVNLRKKEVELKGSW